jgi:octopine/nopaline transport system substrate-binding protein
MGLGITAAILTAGSAFAQAKPTKITIATEGAYAPWNFTEAGGKLAGFEVDLANELCKRMKIECTVVAQDWDGIIPALQAKKYDAIMAGMNINAKRLEVINFSIPYAAEANGFGTLKTSPLAKLPGLGNKLNLAKQTDAAKKAIEEMTPLLKGKTVGVQTSTIHAQFMDKYLKGVVTVREYKTTEQHDLDLAAGRIDAIFASQSAILATAEKPEFKDLTLAGAAFTGDVLGDGVGVGLRKADTELKKMFDEAIASAKADGTLKAISTKWFKTDLTPQS